MFSMVRARLRGLWNRRYFLLAQLKQPEVPVHSLSWLPDGFRIQPVGSTGACVTDGFCSEGEAEQIKSGLTDVLEPLVHRAAMLIGASARELESATLLRVQGSVERESRQLVSSTGTGVRTGGVRVCLDPGQDAMRLLLHAGEQDIEIEPRAGRAVSWFALAGITGAVAGLQAARADSESTGECWMIEFWFGTGQSGAFAAGEPRQMRTGQPLHGGEELPEGIWSPGQDHLEAVFGKPDQIKTALD